MSDENVIDFLSCKQALEEETGLEVTIKKWDGCQHRQRTIDEELRTVYCRNCSTQLDPVEVLIQIARTYASWKVVNQEKELQRYRSMELKIKNKLKYELMTDEEKKMSGIELQSYHSKNGCPRERMYFKGNMVHCFCGWSFNVNSFPKLAAEVEEAHERLRQKNKMRIA